MTAPSQVVVSKVIKGLYSAGLAFLGALGAVLVGSEPLGDVTTGQWVVIAGVTLGAFGGTFGLAGWAGPSNASSETGGGQNG